MPAILSQALRLVLLSGGEFPAIGMIRGGLGAQAIRSRLGQLFPALQPPSITKLISIAQEAIQGGAAIGGLPQGELLPLEVVPVQPFLFGLDPAGERIAVGVDVFVPELDRSIHVTVNLSDAATPQEIAQAAVQIATDRMFASPGAFDVIEIDPDTFSVVDFAFAERRF